MATLNARLTELEKTTQANLVPATLRVIFHAPDGTKREGPSFAIKLPKAYQAGAGANSRNSGS